MKIAFLKEKQRHGKVLAFTCMISAFFCGLSFAGTVVHLDRIPVRFSDLSLASSRFSATKEGLLCIYRYEDEPFRIIEESCIDNGEGRYELRDSRWRDAGDQLAVSRLSEGGTEEFVVVYSLNSATKEYEELWSGRPDNPGPQVNSLSIVGWASDSSIIFSTGCGSSCTDVAILTTSNYESEPVVLGSDYSFAWDREGLGLNGVARSGELFHVDVDLTEPERPELEYSEYFNGCLGSDHWYRADENQFWYKFEERVDGDTILLSRHLCNLGVSFDFANTENIVANKNLEIIDQQNIGSPISLSNDKRRIASIRKAANAYYLDIRNAGDFTAIQEIELAGFAPDLPSIDYSYDFYSPLWSPDDSLILVPKSSISGGVLVIDPNSPSEPVMEMNAATGRFGFHWLSGNKFIAKNLSEVNIYQVEK